MHFPQCSFPVYTVDGSETRTENWLPLPTVPGILFFVCRSIYSWKNIESERLKFAHILREESKRKHSRWRGKLVNSGGHGNSVKLS